MENNNTYFTKTCSKCKLEKSNLEFWECKTGKLGLYNYCKKCTSEINKNKQFEKQKNNKCVKCNCELIGRILSTKYCKECKKEIKREWNRESNKRNYDTIIKYNLKNKESIRKKNAIKETERRKNLTDRYVKKLLYEKNGFTVEQLKNNPQLIELKRLILKIKRL